MSALTSDSLSRLLLGDLLFLIGLVVFLSVCDSGRNRDRIVAAAGTILLGLRYLTWRWTETIDWDAHGMLAMCWPVIFLLTETSRQFDCLHAVLTMSVTTDRRPEADRHEARLRAMDARDLPRVDVFIPTYNEPHDVLYRTVVGAKSLAYPHLRVVILDDGARPWVRAMCAAENVVYIERRNGRHAKAGNINHGLAQTAGPGAAPYILMLDADFVPYRNFLWRTLGFFDDARVAIVQTPQYFFNPDPVQMNLGSPANWAEEQRFFFDAMQPSKDAWGMSFCCGSSCVLRRAAIEAIGGVPVGAVIEDIHLSYVLMAKGWITRYLNETLSNGLASETLGEFVGQRVRWAIGCAQALRLPFGPFGRNGLNLLQRLFYLSTITYWINLVFVLIYVAAPPVYWLFGISPYVADLAELAVYQAPYLIASQVFLIWVGRGRIIPGIWEGVQMVFALDVVCSVFPMLATGKVRTTRATRKGLEVSRTTINWRQMRPIKAFAVLTIGGLCWGLFDSVRYTESRTADQVNVFWTINSLVILGVAAMLCIERPRRRREQRFVVGEAVVLADGSPAMLEDVSLSGVRLRLADAPSRVAFRWRDLPLMVAERVRVGAGQAAYRFEPQAAGERALLETIFTGGFKSQTDRIRFGSFLCTLLGRLLLRTEG